MSKAPSFELTGLSEDSRALRAGKFLLKGLVVLELAGLTGASIAHHERTGETPSVPEVIEEVASYHMDVADFVIIDRLGVSSEDLCAAPPTEGEVQELLDIHHESMETYGIDPYEAAERYDQTLAPEEDASQTYMEMSQATTPKEASEILSDFTERNYGFYVALYGFDKDTDVISVENDDLITQQIRFLRILSLIPKELFDAIDLEMIGINPLDYDTDGLYFEDSNSIVIKPSALANPYVFLHEVGHAVTDTSCGDANDPIVSDANPSGYTYQEDATTYDPNVFANSYGRTNSAEDSATVTGYWATGILPLTYENSELPIGDKLAIIQDRWETISPGIVGYMGSVEPYFTWYPMRDSNVPTGT